MDDPLVELIEPPAEPAPVPPAVTAAPADTIGAFAFELMRAQYWTLRAHEPGVRCGDDPEDLHQMRIAIRRLRAALAVFGDAIPVRAAALRERLGRLGSILGAVRDLDVQVERVAVWAGEAAPTDRETLDTLVTVLEARRARARRHVVKVLGAASFRRLLDGLELFLSRGPIKRSSAARARVRDLAPELLQREHRRVVTLGDHLEPDAPAEALHDLRIRCKRLRYAVDFFEPEYGKPARVYAKKLTQLQNVLGAHQDAISAAATLREVGLDERQTLDRARLLAIGALIERCERESAAARRRFPRRYRRVSGPAWRRLARALEDGRPGADMDADGEPG